MKEIADLSEETIETVAIFQLIRNWQNQKQ